MEFWTRRLIYAAFAVALSIPLITKWVVPPDVGPEARQVFDAVNRVPADKIVLINVQYEGSTEQENGPQLSALLNHVMQRGRRFALIGFDPIGPGLAEARAKPLAARYGRRYGQDWVNLGYKLGSAPILKSLARDLPGTLGKDNNGTPIARIPAMNGVHSAKDIGLLVDVDPTATYAELLAYVAGPYHVPYVVAPTSVMVPDIYPYMNSGQVTGMLKGIAGAAQYERLIHAEGEGYRNRMPIFMAHLSIIALILLGNAQEIRRRRARAAAEP